MHDQEADLALCVYSKRVICEPRFPFAKKFWLMVQHEGVLSDKGWIYGIANVTSTQVT